MNVDLRCLSLHQPWASLCVPLAPGEKPVKTIETRGKPLEYRGRLLIHATKRKPSFGIVVDHDGRVALGGGSTPVLRRWARTRHGAHSYVAHDETLPLGAIIGSCELVDVVPIDPSDYGWDDDFVVVREQMVRYINHNDAQGRRGVEFRDEAAYGDFSPGRYAYLLEDAKRTDERCPACWGEGGREQDEAPVVGLLAPAAYIQCGACNGSGSCDPIPAKGKQGLWRPDDALRAQLDQAVAS